MGWKRTAATGAAGFLGVGVLGLGSVVGWLLATDGSRMQYPETPYPEITASTDPAIIEQGRYLVYGPAHCAQCHTDVDDPADMVTAPLTGHYTFDMQPMAITYSANITSDPETGIGGLSDAEIARAIRTGILHDGSLSLMMRFSAARVSDADLTAIISYLRATEPVRHEVPRGEWQFLGKLMRPMMDFGPRDEPIPVGVSASDEPTIARGEYLANSVMLCVACHSPYDANYQPIEPKAGGGMVEPSHGDDPNMEFAPPNLTSHPTGMTGKLDEDQFVARLRAGRVFKDTIMPWESFGLATDADLRSVYRYLKSLPPVDHDNGPSYRPVGWTPPEG